MIKSLIISMRPRQWAKNLIIFAGLVFAQKLGNQDYLLRTIAAFALFCLVSGAIYIFNDLMDIDNDRIHPRKKNRPIASGKLSVPTAFISALLITLFSVSAAFYLSPLFGVCTVIYIVMMLLYSRFFKHMVILDVLIIALGFVLRAYAGTVVNTDVFVSPWLLACTLFLALFLALCKRRNEMFVLEQTANTHRKVLAEYSPEFLNQMTSIVTSTTVVSYAIYTLSEETIKKFHTKAMVLTFPFVIYGILRYLYLVYLHGKGGEPENILLEDIPFIINIILWLMVVVAVIYSPVKLDEFFHFSFF